MTKFMLITRPDRAPDYLGNKPMNGEVIPGSVLFEDGNKAVVYVQTIGSA